MHVRNITDAYNIISKIAKKTPLIYNQRLSEFYKNNIFLKREDLQLTRSFKIRGAYYKIHKLIMKDSLKSVVCASAGNHAQGIAYACNKLDIRGDIFLPVKTTNQKIENIKYFGKDSININLYGDTFNDCLNKAYECVDYGKKFIHPYNDIDIVYGQGTVAYEIYEELSPDYIICPVGGGGLLSGISLYSKHINPECKVIGVEPENCSSMIYALKNNGPKKLKNIDTFVDGAAVSEVGDINFGITRKYVDRLDSVKDGLLCNSILNLYQKDGIVLEPAGALSISYLDKLKKMNIFGKNIVCVLSGGNNDITRYPDFIEKDLVYQGIKHYYIINFNQKPGELKLFVNQILCEGDDLVRFEYIKRNNSDYGKALIGIEVENKQNIKLISNKLDEYGYDYKKIHNYNNYGFD